MSHVDKISKEVFTTMIITKNIVIAMAIAGNKLMGVVFVNALTRIMMVMIFATLAIHMILMVWQQIAMIMNRYQIPACRKFATGLIIIVMDW